MDSEIDNEIDSGERLEVVLGYADDHTYATDPCYLGTVVGRLAGRIREGRFTLDGNSHQLPLNAETHHLHGGHSGFNTQLWSVRDQSAQSVLLAYTSESGEEGYPGRLNTEVRYSLDDDRSLVIEYRAECDERSGESTVVNLTNHSYFNLAGHDAGDVGKHQLQINGSQVLELDADSLPTGRYLDVADTPFDCRTPQRVADILRQPHSQLEIARGIDHNWVLTPRVDFREEAVAEVYAPQTGVAMRVFTNQPSLLVYSSNYLPADTPGRGGASYGPRHGLCFETQHFPNSPNIPHFPSISLDPGDVYTHYTRFEFLTR
ncbi:MAG: galactose mutarotase [Congregibacter sp.]